MFEESCIFLKFKVPMRATNTINVALKAKAQSEVKALTQLCAVRRPKLTPQEVEDALQDALILWCSRLDKGRIQNPGQPKTWLFRTALRLADRRARRGSKLVALSDIFREPGYNDESISEMFHTSDIETLCAKAAIGREEMTLVRLRALEELSWEEIRAHHRPSTSVQALRQNYHRIMKKLQEAAESER